MTDPNRKGKGYELQIAKVLTPWAGFNLIRTPMSGAWSGTHGDIIPENSIHRLEFPFTIECKKQEGWRLEQVMNEEGPIFDWLAQVEADAARDSARLTEACFPILIFARNYVSSLICIQPSLLDPISEFVRPNIRLESRDEWSYVMMDLNKFLDAYSRTYLLSRISKLKETNDT
jgi:hypothetical protein